LKVIFADTTIGWLGFILEYADYQFEKDQCEGYDLKPSESFKRQCFFTASYDQISTDVSYIRAANILWHTNFPMANSTWPNSREYAARCLDKLPETERRKILYRNASEIYRIETLASDNSSKQSAL
jgi:hypothetical protein